MSLTDTLWESEQQIMTYVGGSRSRRSGIFAGVTDIQGMDMLVTTHNVSFYCLVIYFYIKVYSCLCSTYTAVPEYTSIKRVLRLLETNKEQSYATNNMAVLSVNG